MHREWRGYKPADVEIHNSSLFPHLSEYPRAGKNRSERSTFYAKKMWMPNSFLSLLKGNFSNKLSAL
jgi:hypothetical protein